MSMSGEGGERWGQGRWQGVSPLVGTRLVSEVSTAGDGDGIRKADGGLLLPVVLRPAPGEGISAGLVIPQVGQEPSGAPFGKEVEKAQELPMNPAEVDMLQGREA